MPTISPANAAQYAQSMPLQNFFSTDLLSMNLEQPSDMMNSLGKLSYNEFSMGAASVVMNGSGGWGNMSGRNPQATPQVHNQQNMKAGGMSSDQAHGQDQMGNNGLNPYLGQDASPGWFLSLEGGQDMGFGSVDPFANLFGSDGGMLMADHQGGM